MIPSDLPAETRVLIVDSEANQAAAAATFTGYHVIYPGCELHLLARADRRALAERHVTIWPTAGERAQAQAEACAALLHGHASAIRIVRPNGSPDGLCVASEYWQRSDSARAELIEWVKRHAHDFKMPPEVVETPVSRKTKPTRRGRPRSKPDGSPPAGTQVEPDGSAFVSWESMGLRCNNSGLPFPNLDNLTRILTVHPLLTGKLWYDEFHDQVFSTLWSDQPSPWSEAHDSRLTKFIQSEIRIHKATTNTVREAVAMVASMHIRNEPAEWLRSLQWDGTERLAHLFNDGFGSVFDEYTAAIGRCFMVGMVARILMPGCKMDNAPVLEGSQGVGKSSGLAILGGPFFAESHESVTSKDFFQALQGKMLIEISEMHAFSRADVLRVKGVISCPTDRYRASYGRYTRDHPRRCVFAGTTNVDDWNEDETGARRFWPVVCTEVDKHWLTRHREQLFAEAVALFSRVPLSADFETRLAEGAAWWDVPDLFAAKQQEQRRNADEWEEPIARYCEGRNQVFPSDIYESILGIKLAEIDRKIQMRVAKCLKLAGFKRSKVFQNNTQRRVWEKVVVRGGLVGQEKF